MIIIWTRKIGSQAIDRPDSLNETIPEFEKIREEGISRVRVFESRESQKQFSFNLFSQINKGAIKEFYILGLC